MYDIDTIKHQIIVIKANYVFEMYTSRYRRSNINYFLYESSGSVKYPLHVMKFSSEALITYNTIVFHLWHKEVKSVSKVN